MGERIHVEQINPNGQTSAALTRVENRGGHRDIDVGFGLD